jgi:hypothetical protein
LRHLRQHQPLGFQRVEEFTRKALHLLADAAPFFFVELLRKIHQLREHGLGVGGARMQSSADLRPNHTSRKAKHRASVRGFAFLPYN